MERILIFEDQKHYQLLGMSRLNIIFMVDKIYEKEGYCCLVSISCSESYFLPVGKQHHQHMRSIPLCIGHRCHKIHRMSDK